MHALAATAIAITCAFQYVYASGRIVPPFNSSQIGVIDLPRINATAMPAFCRNFQDICKLEAKGDFHGAFTAYESRYSQCSDHGWSMTGRNQGYDAAVAFKTTPCGTRAVIKGSRRAKTMDNIEKDCDRLRYLGESSAATECPGCFPRFFFFSNVTRACHSEFIQSVSIGRTITSVSSVKSLFLQGVHIIRTLRAHNLEHGDITFRNLLVKKTIDVDDTAKYKLVMFDFAASRHLDEPGDGHMTGNHGFSDLYTLACNFYRNIYREGGCRHRVQPVFTNETRSFKHAFTSIMADNADVNSEPDYTRIEQMIRSVQAMHADY